MASKREGSGRRRVSQADVALRAGVSTGIVSSVVNSRDYGSIRVSESTRERVKAAIVDLGYVPNLAARNLARGNNRLIGVFTYLPLFPMESRDFYHDFLVGIEEGAERAAYNMLLVTGAKNNLRQRAVYANGVNNLQLADGSVLLGSGEDVEELTRLSAEGYPFVYIGQRDPEGVELSYVAADYRRGTASIVRELHALGHRRIAMVQAAGLGEPVPGRRPGFVDACVELGLSAVDRPMFSLAADRAGEPGMEVMPSPDALLHRARDGDVTALVVEASMDALSIHEAADRAGVTVPRDLALVGLGVASSHVEHPGLAELVIPRREMGEEAVRILLRLLAEGVDTPIRTTLPCGLYRGATLGPARR